MSLQAGRAADGQTILALQQAVLPTTVPTVERVSVIAAYRVGGEFDSPVGGDWFAYLCAIISIGALLARFSLQRKTES
jgi:hypothetical protein